MRAFLAFVGLLVLLYVTFALGQLSMKRKYADRRDPLPVIKAARQVVTESNLGVRANLLPLELALDEWDLKHQ